MPSFKCLSPICPALLKERGYCSKHQHLAAPKYDATDRLYDRYRRDKQSKKFYDGAQWKAAEKRQLRAFPVCQRCNRLLAEMVHHIRPVKEVRDVEPRLLLAPENLMSLCNPCHNRIEKTNA